MTHFPKIDMAEVTQLTRAGRLTEAMALLRGETPAAETTGTPISPDDGPVLDLHPSKGGRGGWSGAGEDAKDAAPDLSTPSLAGLARAGAFKGLDLSALGGLTGWSPGGAANAPAIPDGAQFLTKTHHGAGASRDYKLYVPSTLDAGAPAPLIVMLHGCTQGPDDFAAGTRMNALAEEQGFLVAYPAQSQGANAQKCWNWFQPADQQRESGEPSLIAGIVREIIAACRVDEGRIYVAGLSAGGAAAAILGQRYPELFAAIGVHSGLACGAARDMPSAFAAMQGRGMAAGPGDRPVPAIVFHGDRDSTVAPLNGERVLDQALGRSETRVSVETGRSPGGVACTRTIHHGFIASDDGEATDVAPIHESWVLHGAGHAWSGGSAAGSYTEPAGPDASREMLRFFAGVSGAKTG